jgi:hypothetical protein
VTVTAHLPPQAQAFFARDRRWCAVRATEIGPATAELIERLLADRIVERLRAAQGVLRFAETYSPARVEAACARALHHASPFFRTVKMGFPRFLGHYPKPLLARSNCSGLT